MSDKKKTNREFAKSDQAFQDACSQASVEPTPRQASKWRRKIGKAYKRGRFKIVDGGF